MFVDDKYINKFIVNLQQIKSEIQAWKLLERKERSC